MPSEAGNADFAPTDELQDKLMIYLRRTYGRVSCERVVSGPGLMRIFYFLQESGYGVPSKQLLDATKRAGADPTEVIAEYALAKLDPLAVRALDLFIAYGSFAGNIALTALARGGVLHRRRHRAAHHQPAEGGRLRAPLHRQRRVHAAAVGNTGAGGDGSAGRFARGVAGRGGAVIGA